MSVVYGVVARGPTVLCDYTDRSGNFETISATVLARLPSEDQKITYVADEHYFHVIIDDGIVYMCLADKEYKRSQAFGFLTEIKRRFSSGSTNLRQRALTANAYELHRDFSNVLANQMQRFNMERMPDQLGTLQNQLDEVKDIMTQNIEKVLERGEKIEVLIDKTEELAHSAETFKKSSGQLRRQMWWKNKKWCIILIVVLLLVAGVITIIVLKKTHVF
eukprot:m.307801 g.307801  ORF g.307801 m.307801 type:complete len:219 (+) comp42848_c0_seq1:24-680(+)